MNDPSTSGEYWYSYQAYHAHGMLPSEFASLPRRERAIIIAFIKIRNEQEEKAERQAKMKSKKR